MNDGPGPIFGPLIKAAEISDATQDEQEMSKTTTHYLTKHTAWPMVKAMPPGGYGESAASPSGVGHTSAVGSMSGDDSEQDVGEQDVVVDSTAFDAAVRRQVEGAGGTYNIKAAVSEGRAVVVNPSLTRAAQHVQANAGFLNRLAAKAVTQRHARGSASGSASGSGSTTTGGASSNQSASGEMSKADMCKRVVDAVTQYFRGRVFKAAKDPRGMNRAELSKLIGTVPGGSPAHLYLNKLLARASY